MEALSARFGLCVLLINVLLNLVDICNGDFVVKEGEKKDEDDTVIMDDDSGKLVAHGGKKGKKGHVIIEDPYCHCEKKKVKIVKVSKRRVRCAFRSDIPSRFRCPSTFLSTSRSTIRRRCTSARCTATAAGSQVGWSSSPNRRATHR